MQKSILTMLLAIPFMFNACNNSKVAAQNGTPMNDFKVIYQSEYGGTGLDETIIIENQGEFAELWVQATMQPAQSAPHIDFSKKIIIAKHFQSKNSGGTEYTIESVAQKDNSIEINYTQQGPEGMSTMAITNPLIMLEIDKVPNPQVKFILLNNN